LASESGCLSSAETWLATRRRTGDLTGEKTRPSAQLARWSDPTLLHRRGARLRRRVESALRGRRPPAPGRLLPAAWL